MSASSSELLSNRRFLPYFVTQFLGAFNDNIFKNSFLLFVAFAKVDELAISSNLFINLAAGLFILPYFLFSASAGELADKYEKSGLIRRIKLLEIIIMMLGAVGFITNSYIVLLFLLFLMGTQSALFGPVKYSLLPQHLKANELIQGNALVESGTFLAILLGTVGAGVITSSPDAKWLAAVTVVVLAMMGYLASRYIPHANPDNPSLEFRWRPYRQTRHTLHISRQDRTIWLTIMVISWFWFLGAVYLTQFPNFTRLYLHGHETAVSWLLTLFSVGIAIGSLLCARVSFGRVELGLVTLACGLISLFGGLLPHSLPEGNQVYPSLSAFIMSPSLWPLFGVILMIGISGGLFIVPLYTLLQKRARPTERAQVIAALNIFNALFMVGSALLGILCLSVFKLSIPQLFTVLAWMNTFVFIYLLYKTPIYTLRFILSILAKVFYRLTFTHIDRVPQQGGAIIVCNHVSYIDALLLNTASPRLIRFVMEAEYANFLPIQRLLKQAGVIPINAQSPPSIIHALDEIKHALEKGDLVCIFPEGKLTPDGEIHDFMRGIDLILKRNDVPVIPMAIKGLWGSYFSRAKGKACRGMPTPLRRKIEVEAGTAIAHQHAQSDSLKQAITDLITKN